MPFRHERRFPTSPRWFLDTGRGHSSPVAQILRGDKHGFRLAVIVFYLAAAVNTLSVGTDQQGPRDPSELLLAALHPFPFLPSLNCGYTDLAAAQISQVQSCPWITGCLPHFPVSRVVCRGSLSSVGTGFTLYSLPLQLQGPPGHRSLSGHRVVFILEMTREATGTVHQG